MHASSPVRGRDREISSLTDLLSRGDVRLVTLTGLAGVGKSRVLAWVLSNPPVDRAPIARVDTAAPDGLLPAIAFAAGLDASLAPDIPAVAAALDAAPLIVVVDGAHPVPDAGEVIERLLASTESTRFVVTNRVPLGIAGERIARIETFRPSQPGTGPLPENPGVQLFVDVAATVGVDVSDDPRALADTAAICERLGGLPGAIELAALRSPAFGPSTMRKLLEGAAAYEVLSGSTGDTDWIAAVSWIEALVEPEQRRLIRDLTVFHGPVPIDAVVAVTGLDVADAVDLVSELVDMHLLDTDHRGAESTYVLHPLVREYAEATIDSGHDHRLDAAHERWALDVAAADRAAAARTEVALVEGDLVAVLQRCLDRSDADAAATIAASLGPLWMRRGIRARDDAQMARVATSMADHGSDQDLRALVTGWSALFGAERAMNSGDIASVVAARDDALALAEHGDDTTRLAVLGICVQITRVLDDHQVAVRLCDEGLLLARRRGDEYNQARFEIWSGMVAHQERRIDDALSMGEAALGTARLLGDASLIINAAGLLLTLPPTAEVSVALPAASELVELARQLDDRRSLLWLRPVAAAEALRAGDHAAAGSFVVDHMVAARADAAWSWSSVSLLMLVQLAVAEGDDERAAWLHGIVAGQLDVLRPTLPPGAMREYDLVIELLRERLRIEQYDAMAARGSLLSMKEAHAEAVVYARSIVDRLGAQDDGAHTTAGSLLTVRETEVVARLVAGDRNKDIARRLGITPKTVMHHTSNIYRKLGVRGRSETVAWALRGPNNF